MLSGGTRPVTLSSVWTQVPQKGRPPGRRPHSKSHFKDLFVAERSWGEVADYGQRGQGCKGVWEPRGPKSFSSPSALSPRWSWGFPEALGSERQAEHLCRSRQTEQFPSSSPRGLCVGRALFCSAGRLAGEVTGCAQGRAPVCGPQRETEPRRQCDQLTSSLQGL